MAMVGTGEMSEAEFFDIYLQPLRTGKLTLKNGSLQIASHHVGQGEEGT